MLLHDLLKGKRLVLASKSPRRRELLKGLDVDFDIWDTNHDDEEPYPVNLPLTDVPIYLAKHKASQLAGKLDTNTILITCDTVVICGINLGNQRCSRCSSNLKHLIEPIAHCGYRCLPEVEEFRKGFRCLHRGFIQTS